MKPWEEDNNDFLAKWLNDELDEKSKKAFENSTEGKEIIKLVQATDNLVMSPFDVNQAYDRYKSSGHEIKMKPSHFYNRPIIRLAIAASIITILAISFLLNKSNYTIEKTSIGENRRVELPDGSSIMLNANSSLKYNKENWIDERTIILEGEAFFEVKRGNEFIVQTDEGNIKVLGTSFNVRARDDLLKVICYTGKVNVSNLKNSNDLTPGNLIILENGEILELSNDDNVTLPSWIRGVSEFNNATFKTVLNELKNHYELKVNYNGSFDNERLKVTFPNKNLELSISIVMKALNIRYTFDSSNNVLDILGKN